MKLVCILYERGSNLCSLEKLLDLLKKLPPLLRGGGVQKDIWYESGYFHTGWPPALSSFFHAFWTRSMSGLGSGM